MLTLRQQMIVAFERYAGLTGVSESTLSDRLLKSGARLKLIRDKSDISTGTFERVMQWFSANWPDGAEWPEGVARPSPAETSPEAAE